MSDPDALHRLMRFTVLVALLALAACGGGTSIVGDDGSYVPNFTFVWDEVDGAGAFVSPTHRFALLVDQTGQKSGAFSSSSNEQLNGAFNALTGTFMNRTVTISVDRGGTRVTMTGRFLDDNTIQLREPSRTYNVKRNENP
jgi:hypothetical protein